MSSMVLSIATIAAIVLGPVLAVIVTRYVDDLRSRHQRRMHIFRALMGTRRMNLSAEHVSSLNMIEVEFYGCAPVIEAYRQYWAHLGTPAPESTAPGAQTSFREERDSLLARLIKEIGVQVKMPMDQLDIFRGGYVPQAWQDQNDQEQALRLHLINLLIGQRPLSVVWGANPGAPYPPAPPADGRGIATG